MSDDIDFTARLTALMRLAAATRERVDRMVYDVYLENPEMRRVPTAALVETCRRLETEADWFPKLKELHRACELTEIAMDRAARPRLPDDPLPPKDTARLERFLKSLPQLARGERWPK